MQNDFVDWGPTPPPGGCMPVNPKTMTHGLPFFSKPVNKDYGNFGQFKGKPIIVEREPHKRYSYYDLETQFSQMHHCRMTLSIGIQWCLTRFSQNRQS